MRSFLFFIFIIVLSINANANTISKVKNINDIEWEEQDWEDSPESLAKDKVVWCVTPQGIPGYCYGGTKKLKLEKAEGNYFYLKSGNSCLRAGNKFSMGKCKKSDNFLYEQIVTEQIGGTFINKYDEPDEASVHVVFKIKNSNQYIGLGKDGIFYKAKDISDAYGKSIGYVDPCLKDSIENLQGEEKVYCTCSFSWTLGRNKKDYDKFLALYPKIKAKLKKDVYYPLACLDAVEAYRELGTMVAEATTKSDTKVHTKTYNEGVYTGGLKNNKKHGQGTFTWSNGDKYVGEFKDGLRHGKAKVTYANGNIYIGEFKDDKKNGLGTWTSVGGDKYVGEFKDGLRHGQGRYTFSSGGFENGIYRNDIFIEQNNKVLKLNEKKQIVIKNSNEVKTVQNETKKIISNKTSNSLDEKGYADCILENMKDVSSDEAAKAIKEACTYKYLSDNNNSNVVSNSNENTSTYSDNTIGVVSLPTNLSSCGSITTTRFPIFTGC